MTMKAFLYLLPVLVCPIAMGAMMYVMMRPGRGHQAPTSEGSQAGEQELAQLRGEVEALRARLADTDPASQTTPRARP
jgi:hypothetical protein